MSMEFLFVECSFLQIYLQASAITGTLYDLFQIVFQMRKEAGLAKKVSDSPQALNSSKVSNGEIFSSM